MNDNGVISKKHELESIKDTIKRGTADWCMWIAKYFLVTTMLHFKCDVTEVVDYIIKYRQTEIPLSENIINIYNKAAYELMLELEP